MCFALHQWYFFYSILFSHHLFFMFNFYLSPHLAELRESVQLAFSVTPDLSGPVSNQTVDGQTYVWMRRFDAFSFDARGRASLPAMAFNASALVIEIPQDIYR